MIDPILNTKLHMPILHKDIIPRPRLAERLNYGLWQEEGFVRKLTLVSAPPGFGKTTLVAGWLHALASPTLHQGEGRKIPQNLPLPPGEGWGVRTAWLSLDGNDNDPARFLAYLIAALRQIQPEFGSITGAILQSPQLPPSTVIMTSLVNELSGMPAPFILALDDYHAIHSPPIHQQVAFILDNQPANMHLVILTREDPLLPIARLRARGQIVEIRQDDLRFTQAEISNFLQHKPGLSLDVNDIDALERHTEGWIAGLQLAALSMQGRNDLKSFVRGLTGSNRYILDYLVEEVFERQPTEVQEFLLKTSILGQLCASLCDAVMERPGSQDTLRTLEQVNLFIVPLDQTRTWYRYHHLFAELLRHRLRASEVALPALHQRASLWYEEQGAWAEAVEHALEAQDWGSTARLIGKANEGMLKRGEVVTLLGWFSHLPKEITCAHLGLCMTYAWAALLASQFDIAAPLLVQAEGMAPPGSHLLGQVAAAQAYLARSKRDNSRAIEKSQQALTLLPETDIVMRGNIAMNLGLAYWHEGRMAEAEPVLRQACDLSGRAGNSFALLTAQIFLARIAAVEGKLQRCAAMLEKLIQVGGQAPILCLAHYDLATIHLEWNHLQKAREHLEQGLALSLRSGNVELRQSGYLLQAILAQAQGDAAGAQAALEEADVLAKDFPAVVRSRTAALGVQLALARGDPQMLAHWAEQVNADVDAHAFYRFLGLTRPRLLIAQGEKEKASEILKALYSSASQAGWGYGMIAVRILQSLAVKSTDEALPFIVDALGMGRPEGFMRSFVDAGRDVIPVLQAAAARDIEPEYARQILAALGVEPRKENIQHTNLVESLSEREIEVLRWLTVGLSNREIAAKLVISPGTAKTHIHNLCGKLGVRNRTEAAMKAKELGLV